MTLAIQILCLGLTILVIQKYVTTGTHSYSHRLLPLVLGLIGVYDFYEIVESITQETELFTRLKYLLLIQMLYLLFFYAMDIMHVKLPGIIEMLLLLLLMGMNTVMLLQLKNQRHNETFLWLYVVCFTIGILGVATYAYIRYAFSKRERLVTSLLYTSLLIPSLGLLLEKKLVMGKGVIMPLALAMSCGTIYYLLMTDRLVEAKYFLREKLYDTAEMPIIFFDPDYYFLEANQKARELFAGTIDDPKEKMNQKNYLDMIRELAGRRDRQCEIQIGEDFYKCQLTAVFGEEKLKGYSLSLLDITKEKKNAQRMEALKDEAVSETERKSRFLATMSHDLRTPLHAIIGISDILTAKRDMSAQNRSLVTYMKTAGNTLLEQVNAILDFSKLEAGKLELSQNPYDLKDVVKELTYMCAINLQSKPVKFSASILTPFPKELLGDEMRVREMIQNLLGNAIKYTRQGEISCTITCNMEPEKNRVYIKCSVRDTGSGIDQENLTKIFNEYVTVSDGKAIEGAGLGLYIVSNLSKMMGGRATVSSDGKTGSVFTVSFYQEIKDKDLQAAVTFTGESVLRQSHALEESIQPNYIYPNARILLADDMHVNREIFRELALPWQFAVDFAENGREAVEAVKNKQYQLIFLDQMMPVMTGDEAAKEIREFCDTPMILMSANLGSDIAKECLEWGFSDFLAKPVDLPALQRVIEQYLPQQYQKQIAFHPEKLMADSSRSNSRAYRRTLETFVQEIQPLATQLPEYLENNLELFRIKVHGIKGVSRQIDKMYVAELAEIMEMAAKTQNLSYIQSHMAEFLYELSKTLEDVKLDLKALPKEKVQQKDGAQQGAENVDVKELFAQLKSAFDAYALDQIEECIQNLESCVLSDEHTKLLSEVKEAYEDLDYEKGSELLS